MGGILFVCEGNLCRSPYAELVSKLRLDALTGSQVDVSSAGIRAQVGSEMPNWMANPVRAQGADPSTHRARQLDRGMIAGASLVLVAERSQRSAVVHLHPPALRYTFTIRHLEHALGPLRVGRASAAPLFEATASDPVGPVVEVLRQGFDHIRSDPVVDDDVIDPYGRSKSTHIRAVLQMRPALDLLVRSFGADGLSPVAQPPFRSRFAPRRRRSRWKAIR